MNFHRFILTYYDILLFFVSSFEVGGILQDDMESALAQKPSAGGKRSARDDDRSLDEILTLFILHHNFKIMGLFFTIFDQ